MRPTRPEWFSSAGRAGLWSFLVESGRAGLWNNTQLYFFPTMLLLIELNLDYRACYLYWFLKSTNNSIHWCYVLFLYKSIDYLFKVSYCAWVRFNFINGYHWYELTITGVTYLPLKIKSLTALGWKKIFWLAGTAIISNRINNEFYTKRKPRKNEFLSIVNNESCEEIFPAKLQNC